MDEAKVKVAAGGFAGVAILGLAAFSVLKAKDLRGKVHVLEQWNSATSGPFPGLPPGIYLRVEKPSTDPNEIQIETRVTDASGFEYPTRTVRGPGDAFYDWIPLGYAHPVVSPRLVVSAVTLHEDSSLPTGGKPAPGQTNVLIRSDPVQIDSIPLRDFPLPQKNPLPLSSDAPFCLRRAGEKIFVNPITGKIPEGDWHLDALATPYAPDLTEQPDAHSIGPSSRWSAWSLGAQRRPVELYLPYPSDTDAVKVCLTVTPSVEKTELIRIPDLRLVRKQGETVFDLPTPLRISTHSGATMVVTAPPVQRRVSQVDHRNPILWITFEAKDHGDKAPDVRVQLVSPSPESLGLRSLTIGKSVLAKTFRSGPVPSPPFGATLRVTHTETGIGLRRIYTVPIR